MKFLKSSGCCNLQVADLRMLGRVSVPLKFLSLISLTLNVIANIVTIEFKVSWLYPLGPHYLLLRVCSEASAFSVFSGPWAQLYPALS